MKTSFDHEKLDVYQDAIRFVCTVDELLKDVPKSLAVHNQLDRASTSIPLNIAEGNGKYGLRLRLGLRLGKIPAELHYVARAIMLRSLADVRKWAGIGLW